jgi:cardiolipin synthase (CMP-forming)
MTPSLSWLPNAICIFRIALVAPVVYALVGGRFGLALALIAVAAASDGLDGFLAKTFGWRTRLGSLLDPAADKLLVTSVFLTLAWLGVVPWLVTAIVILRDVVIVLGAAAYQLVIGPVTGQPTLISKMNTGSQLLFVLAAITAEQFAWPPRLAVVLLGAAVVFTSLSSGMHYVVRWGRRAWRAAHAAS